MVIKAGAIVPVRVHGHDPLSGQGHLPGKVAEAQAPLHAIMQPGARAQFADRNALPSGHPLFAAQGLPGAKRESVGWNGNTPYVVHRGDAATRPEGFSETDAVAYQGATVNGEGTVEIWFQRGRDSYYLYATRGDAEAMGVFREGKLVSPDDLQDIRFFIEPQAARVSLAQAVSAGAEQVAALQGQIRTEIFNQVGMRLGKQHWQAADGPTKVTIVIDMATGRVVPFEQAKNNPPAAYYHQSVFVDARGNKITFSPDRRAILNEMARGDDPAMRVLSEAFRGLDGARAVEEAAVEAQRPRLGMGDPVAEIVDRPSAERIAQARRALVTSSMAMTVMGQGGLGSRLLAVPILLGVIRMDAEGNIVGKDVRRPADSSPRGSHHKGGIDGGAPIAVVLGEDGTLYSADPLTDLNPKQRAMLGELVDASAPVRDRHTASHPYFVQAARAELDGMLNQPVQDRTAALPTSLIESVQRLPYEYAGRQKRYQGDLALVYGPDGFEFKPMEDVARGVRIYGTVRVDVRAPDHVEPGRFFSAFQPDPSLPQEVAERVEGLLGWVDQRLQKPVPEGGLWMGYF